MRVNEVLHQVLPRLPGPALCSIFEAVGAVQSIISGRLLLRRSDLLIRESDAELVFAPGAGKKGLPADFAELSGRPYLDGGKKLDPLADRDTSALQEPGTPRYYRVIGRVLMVYPPAEAQTAVRVPYFFRPEAPTALTDEIPFYGMFDEVMVEGCAAVLSRGLAAVADRDFVAVIASQVDAVLEAKDLAAEQLLADSINGL